MTDVMTVVSLALSNIGSMKEIISTIQAAKSSYKESGLQLEVAKLAALLRENEEELRKINEMMIKKDERIAELESALKDKDNLIRYHDAYYEKDSNGNASGNPFCLGCWHIKHKKVPLQRKRSSANTQVCPACKTEQETRRAPPNVLISI